MQQSILSSIQNHGDVTFATLQELPGAKGDFDWEIQPNMVLWSGLSEEFIEAIRALRTAGLIEMQPTHYLCYAADGVLLTLPLVKRHPPKGGFKKRRWLPVAFVAKRSAK